MKGLTVQEDLRFRQSSLSILVFICNNIYRVWEDYSSGKLKVIFIVL